MLRRVALALALLACTAVAQDNATRAPATPCGDCCAPGGACDAAFKGTPGICCGVIAERPFCCPSVGSSFGVATCYRSGDAFRCRAASPSRSSSSAPRPVMYHTTNRGYSWAWWLFFLVIPALLIGLCVYGIIAARNRQKEAPSMVAMTPMQQGPPGGPGAAYGYPVAGQQPMYAQQQGGGTGGGGTSPWMAGGAGLLGGACPVVLLGCALLTLAPLHAGYMLGSTLGGGRSYYPGGGAYYGGGGGGGDYAASSDVGGGFGGGGGDFAADS
jgi:hypothetical protein